jgi:hypothetical protein
MTNSQSVRIACGMLVLGVVVAASAHVWALGHENRLTFNKAVSLPGVVLPAGAYSFDVADAGSALNIVVVRNADRTKLFYMGFTNPVDRPKNLSKNATITLGEAPANEPAPIAVWYPTGESVGHQFRY